MCELFNTRTDSNWISFEPTSAKTSKDINYSLVTRHSRTTSCYPIPLFLEIDNLMTNEGDVFEATKGLQKILDNNSSRPYVIVLFRLTKMDGTIIYYDNIN